MFHPALELTVRIEGDGPPPMVLAETTLRHAVLNLLNNAADASPDAVEIEARWTDDELTLEIADRGAGLAPEAAQQAGEAIFSTKDYRAPVWGSGCSSPTPRSAGWAARYGS